MRSILSELNRLGRLVIVDNLTMDRPQTKTLIATLNALGANKALLILAEDNTNIELSARNLQWISVCNSSEIDPLSLLGHEKVVVTVDAAKLIDEALK